MPDYEREHVAYRRRVAARYAAIRAARAEGKQDELAAYRRLSKTSRGFPTKRNRRPALCLAAVFLALVVALIFVARTSGSPTGTGGLASHAVSQSRDTSPPSRSAVRSIICSVFTGTRCGPAIRVAKCETGGTFSPRALGSAGERGLFQIHPVHFGSFDKRRLFEPRYNTRAAFRLSRGGRDWSPWSCQP